MNDKWTERWLRESEPTGYRRTLAELAVVFIALLGLLCAFAGSAAGAPCSTCNVKKKVAVQHVQVAQPLVYPQVYYQVAPHLQERSLIRYEVKEALKEALAELRQQPLQQQAECAECQNPGIRMFAQQSVLATSCIKCHSGESPKKSLSLDVELNDETRAKIARKILANEMPVDGDGNPVPLGNEAKSQLLIELFGNQ